jgi:hypothetical protein
MGVSTAGRQGERRTRTGAAAFAMTCPASLLVESQTLLVVAAFVWMAAWTMVLKIAITPAPLVISSYGLSGLAITAYGRPVNILPFAISLAVVLLAYLIYQALPLDQHGDVR